MLNARIHNSKPSAGIRGGVPSARTPSFQTGHSGEPNKFVTAGTPIGLLLALTYANDMFLDYNPYGPRPNAYIRNA